MKLSTLILCCLFSFSAFGQTKVNGIILNATTMDPIPYVNIGILNKKKGTVSNKFGEFTLESPVEYINDTIKISSIGYEPKIFILRDFIEKLKENNAIKLLEKVTELNEIVISNKKKLKEKILGNKTKSKIMQGGFSNAELGNELGIKIKIKKSPTYITKFHTNVTSNTGREMKFRLNFYDIEKGLPKKKLINKNIIFSIDSIEGLFTLDLTEYDIVVDNDFYLTVELVGNNENKEGEVLFSAGLLGNATVTRWTSQTEWEKLGSIGIGFSVTAEY